MTEESFVDSQDRLHSEMVRIWGRLLETSDFSIDDDFFDKGGDSLLATEFMLELRQLTGKALPDSVLFESSTIRSLAQRLSQSETPEAKAVVRIGPGSGGAAPLLFFHGDWTWGGFYVEHLARKLGPEFSLIAVAPHGPGGEPIPSSIEAMAADRLPAILAEQPTGPYRLAGHCVGGIVALETARLLMRLNHRVEAVVMIDSPLMIGGAAPRIPQAESRAPEIGAREPVRAPDDAPVEPASPEFDWGLEHYQRSLAAYSPIPLPVSLLVLASQFDGRGWVQLSGDADLIEIPGGHFDWVTGRINDLARYLRSWPSGDAASSRASRPSLIRLNGEAIATRGDEQTPASGAPKTKSYSRPLRWILNTARQ
jgi:oxalate---CoA ligase